MTTPLLKFTVAANIPNIELGLQALATVPPCYRSRWVVDSIPPRLLLDSLVSRARIAGLVIVKGLPGLQLFPAVTVRTVLAPMLRMTVMLWPA